MMNYRLTKRLAVLVCLFALAGCGSGAGGGSGSSPEQGIYRGHIEDANGNAVAGARVSIDGLEAETVTDANGFYEVSDPELSTATLGAVAGARVAAGMVEVEISVLVPGFAPLVSTLNVAEGGFADVDLVRTGLEPNVTVSSPRAEETFVLDADCESSVVTVEGFAALKVRPSFRLDVVLVADRSGSTADPAFDVDGDSSVDTVLDAEVEALKCFVEGLDSRTTRVAVVEFNDSAATVSEFTDDLDAVVADLDGVGPSSGGTNFEAAFTAAEDLLVALQESDEAAEPAEESAAPMPASFKAVVFVSDGIATSHGVPRDMTDSNLSQSSADRHGAIDAAAALGDSTGAQLFAFSVIPANDVNKKRTTLPHCVAACGGGRYESLDNFEGLSATLCGEPLDSVLAVEIVNLTLGSDPVTADMTAGGSFSAQVSVAAGPPDVVGAPGADGTVENTLQVTLTAFAGTLALTDTETVTVRLINDSTYDLLTTNEIFATTAASAPVSATNHLKRPTGGNLGDNTLYNFLVGASTAEFEDAIELKGVETFTAKDPLNANVTVTVDMVFKEACYRSDVGYFIVNPSSLPTSATTLLNGLDGTNVLFNTGDEGTTSCSGQSIAQGSARVTFTVPSNSVLAFFVLPNRRLAEFQANPRLGEQPLFTLTRLNPGKFDQALSFRSEDGRTQAGASTVVVAAGPMMIFAFDDQPTLLNLSDQDFDDVVFTVSSQAVARAAAGECADD